VAGADDTGLERALAELHRGPLEDFIRRRDALSKELRAARKREQATTVKGLRKPSRTAWALNLAVLGDGDALGPVVAAVGETVDAQTRGGDVRRAIARLRTTVRDFAGRASGAAEAGGYGVGVGVLSNSLFAVLGDTESFGQLRRGRLTDVPEAGGLDLLNTLLAPGSAGVSESPPKAPGAAPLSSPPPRSPSLPPPPPPKAVADDTVAREAVRRTAAALATARDRSTASQAALRSAEAKVAAAEARLRAADADARTLRAERDRARQEADAAATQQRAAETAAGDAERQLDEVRRQGP
jgi:hypothetical protein